MTSQSVAGDGRPSRRNLHASAASLGTNASGIAASTISGAGSELSGISLFPVPPTELPTPTGSNSGTPTSLSFARRFPPSITDYETPTHFRSATPPSSRSPTTAPNDARSLASNFSSRSGGNATAMRGWEPSLLQQDIHVRNPAPIPIQDPLSLLSPPSTSYQPIRPLAYKKNSLPKLPVTGYPPVKRPETPHSVTAASSLLDWSDATSGISIDPNEERLLTTSFITHLLSQAPDLFPGQKNGARDRDLRGLDKKDDGYVSTLRNRDALPSHHQSIPPFYPSDLLSVEGREAFNSQQTPLPSAGRQSYPSDSRRASKDYPDTFHSDEQLQPVIRKPSITISRGRVEALPVAVVPAIRISSTLIDSNNSASDPLSTSSNPPHRADAPQNAQHTCNFVGDGAPRESVEVLAIARGGDSHQDQQPEAGRSTALPNVDSRNRNIDLSSKWTSVWNRGSSCNQGLRRNQSIKSVVSSLVSRISNSSAVQREKYLAWLRQRPLPPLPMGSNRPPEFPNGKEIKQSEEAIPLPTLVKRAEDLSGMLNRGSFPSNAREKNRFYYKESSAPLVEDLRDNDYRAYVQFDRSVESPGQRTSLFSRLRFRKEEHQQNPSPSDSPSSVKATSFDARCRRRKLWAISICAVIGIALAVALPVGLSQRKHSTLNCSGNQTGVSCTLDATCMCTGTGDTCKPLARSLFLLVPYVNELFAANFTASEMSDAVVNVEGASPDGLCDKQALLIDVEPGLDTAVAPNRTIWAQAAMLWNLGLSEDGNAANALKKFVSTAPWDDLSSVDGPVDDPSGAFACNVSGYIFDFAAQSINPQSASFKNSSPSEAQLEEVSSTAEEALDRMYSFGIASSTQREKALINYWINVLQQQQSDLGTFRNSVQSSPFLIPFDATSSPGGDALTSQMGNTSSTQFPIPISCYPGLSSSQLAAINTLETTAFGLDPVSAASNFSSNCFPERPVYGVVDILRLRLPFLDNKEGLALQASALSSDATIRAIVYAGEVLSAFPDSISIPNISSTTSDPREFGTVDFMDHVLLNYLSSISNVTLAMNLVSYVLSSDTPISDFASANPLSSIPVLEFAVFGSVRSQDIAFSVSSFSTPTGSLFFGSDAGQTFRSWALVNSSASINWAESATSAEVVHEGSSINSNFESVWTPASELVASGSTNSSDVQEVVASLSSLGLFSP